MTQEESNSISVSFSSDSEDESGNQDASRVLRKLLPGATAEFADSWGEPTNDQVNEIEAQKNLKIVDLTGAGDLFAAGYLHGFINNFSQRECLEKGNELSAKVIQQIGARF